MTYDPDIQFRAVIIRGRAKNLLDHIIPAYANIINDSCPCSFDTFIDAFDNELSEFLIRYTGKLETDKALANHRTEIAGKLFGMYFIDENRTVRISSRTIKLMNDWDHPAFFKDICFKFQLPNPSAKPQTYTDHMNNGLNIRQCSYIIELLRIASDNGIILTKDEIGYYVLNSLHALQSKVEPATVLNVILQIRAEGIEKIVSAPGKAASYNMQHINETFNYLELANLIKVENKDIYLNTTDTGSIKTFSDQWDKPLLFNTYDYDIETVDGRKEMQIEWDRYYSELATQSVPDTPAFKTTTESLTWGKAKKEEVSTVELGDEGEEFVYHLEKTRVKNYQPSLEKKVLLLGKIKGLGFDIQSVFADFAKEKRAEHAIFVEVKTTKRTTPPKSDFEDTVTITRTEWVAADQHRDAYFIYRIYFTPDNVYLFIINDPITESEKGMIKITPTAYRVEFNQDAGYMHQA